MAKKKSKLDKDTYLEREKAKYDDPIYSREYILEFLTEHGIPCLEEKIADLLNLKSESKREALRRRLRAMIRDGQLFENRRGGLCVVDKKTSLAVALSVILMVLDF